MAESLQTLGSHIGRLGIGLVETKVNNDARNTMKSDVFVMLRSPFHT
jgi:hypothetical protein